MSWIAPLYLMKVLISNVQMVIVTSSRTGVHATWRKFGCKVLGTSVFLSGTVLRRSSYCHNSVAHFTWFIYHRGLHIRVAVYIRSNASCACVQLVPRGLKQAWAFPAFWYLLITEYCMLAVIWFIAVAGDCAVGYQWNDSCLQQLSYTVLLCFQALSRAPINGYCFCYNVGGFGRDYLASYMPFQRLVEVEWTQYGGDELRLLLVWIWYCI